MPKVLRLPLLVALGSLPDGSWGISEGPRVVVKIMVPFLGVHIKRDIDICRSIDMDGCQNYGPFLGRLNTRCRIILRTQQGTIILTTTHMGDI